MSREDAASLVLGGLMTVCLLGALLISAINHGLFG